MIVVGEVYVELAAADGNEEVRRAAPELGSPATAAVGATGGGTGPGLMGPGPMGPGLMGPAMIAVGAERP